METDFHSILLNYRQKIFDRENLDEDAHVRVLNMVTNEDNSLLFLELITHPFLPHHVAQRVFDEGHKHKLAVLLRPDLDFNWLCQALESVELNDLIAGNLLLHTPTTANKNRFELISVLVDLKKNLHLAAYFHWLRQLPQDEILAQFIRSSSNKKFVTSYLEANSVTMGNVAFIDFIISNTFNSEEKLLFTLKLANSFQWSDKDLSYALQEISLHSKEWDSRTAQLFFQHVSVKDFLLCFEQATTRGPVKLINSLTAEQLNMLKSSLKTPQGKKILDNFGVDFIYLLFFQKAVEPNFVPSVLNVPGLRVIDLFYNLDFVNLQHWELFKQIPDNPQCSLQERLDASLTVLQDM